MKINYSYIVDCGEEHGTWEGARIGEPCKNPVAHQQTRGPADHRAQPLRPHNSRRLAWVESKHP